MQKMRIVRLAVAATMLVGSTAIMAMDPGIGPNAGPAPIVVNPPPKTPSRAKMVFKSITQSSKAKWGLGGAVALGFFGFVHRTNIFHGRKLTQPVIDGLKKWGENLKKGDTGTIFGTLGFAAALGMGAYWMWGGSNNIGGAAGLKGIRGKVQTTYNELQLLQSINDRIIALNGTVDQLNKEANEAEEVKRNAEATGNLADIADATTKYNAAQKAHQEALTQEAFDKRNVLIAQLQEWGTEVQSSAAILGADLDTGLDTKAASKAVKRKAVEDALKAATGTSVK